MISMSQSVIKTYRYPDGSIQRVQTVHFDDWNSLEFYCPSPSPQGFSRLVRLYQDYIVPKYSFAFNRLVLFRIPEEMEVPFPGYNISHGTVYDPLIATAIAFNNNVKIHEGHLIFRDRITADFYNDLTNQGCLAVAQGRLPGLTFLPVRNTLGLLSEGNEDALLKVNSSFFIMDRFDCGSIYDTIGTPFGLMVKDGDIICPPLFNRETLIVRNDSSVSIEKMDVTDLTVTVDGTAYVHGRNALFCTRPQYRLTPTGGSDIIVTGNKVAALKSGGSSTVPSSGFVIHLNHELTAIKDTQVHYQKMDDVRFAIQCGNSTVVDGKRTTRFISPFYDLRKPWTPSFPPSMYPLGFARDRAPRIILGGDVNNKPMLIWIEGAGKFGYREGVGSCGASLSEAGDICIREGMHNGIHLDGGGSAQMIYKGTRKLQISDRNSNDFSETERAIPIGLIIR